MPWSTTFKPEGTGIEIAVSQPAQKLIGPKKLPEFVKLLTELMEGLGAETAYVSKSGVAVEISMVRSDGWTGTMQIKSSS